MPTVALAVARIATGARHNDRSIAAVALRDCHSGESLLSQYIRPAEREEVFSYLTPFSGVSEQQIASGVSLDEAKRLVADCLQSRLSEARGGPDDGLTLLGIHIAASAEFFELREGVHYSRLLDFRDAVLAHRHMEPLRSISYISLRHFCDCAALGIVFAPGADAETTIITRVFQALFSADGAPHESKIRDKQLKALDTLPQETLEERVQYRWEGVCLRSTYATDCCYNQPH